MSKVVVIVGPTAIGKSALSIELAKRFNGEIINGDSIQVYKELNIGSAKIAEEEMQGIKHHLLSYKSPNEEYNVAVFQQDGRKAIEQICDENKLPIVVGGTGLYIKALLYDYQFMKEENKDDEDYSSLDNEKLYVMLQELDYSGSLTIHPNNRKRIIRAIQMAKQGQPKSIREQQQEHKMLYDAKIIALTMDRDKLKNRINNRIDIMIESGLMEEINYLFSEYSLNSHCFQGIGYKEFIPYYNGQKSLEECIEDVKTHTKQFAKRQYTWFRHQLPVNWYDIEDENYPQNVYADIKEFLNE